MNIYFGENIKRLRSEQNLTQEALAGFLGVSFQTISKWERGETYPDIAMLPVIATFFKVSIDNLLGLDNIERENKIKEYCDKYSRLWSEHKIPEVRELMKQAVAEFPGNFDLLSKYLNALISSSNEDTYLISIKTEVQRVYDSIQNYCTTDSIRIWSKKLMCRYFRNMSLISDSGVDISEAERILSEMPIMQNTRDYEAMFMYPNDEEKRTAACANGISEMLYLFGEIISRKHSNPLDFEEDVLEAYVNLLEAIMPDGDYGKSFHHIIYDNGYIGLKEYLKGNVEEALEYFEKMCKFAVEYDKLPDIAVHTSENLKGLTFNKNKMLLGTSKMTERVKYNLTNNYPLSADFKCSEKFKKIVEILV